LQNVQAAKDLIGFTTSARHSESIKEGLKAKKEARAADDKKRKTAPSDIAVDETKKKKEDKEQKGKSGLSLSLSLSLITRIIRITRITHISTHTQPNTAAGAEHRGTKKREEALAGEREGEKDAVGAHSLLLTHAHTHTH
jgi:hypothetical protein